MFAASLLVYKSEHKEKFRNMEEAKLLFSNHYEGDNEATVNISLTNNNLSAANSGDEETLETVFCSKTALAHVEGKIYYFEVHIDKIAAWTLLGFAAKPIKIIGNDWIGNHKGQLSFGNDAQCFKEKDSVYGFNFSELFAEGSTVSFVVQCKADHAFLVDLFTDGEFRAWMSDVSAPQLYFGVTMHEKDAKVTINTENKYKAQIESQETYIKRANSQISMVNIHSPKSPDQ
jgi:hypothetical protein